MPSLIFGHPTTNAFIQLIQIIKQSITPVQYTSPLTVVPNSDPVSSLRVTHNVAPLGTVKHNNMVPLIVPKNNPVSSLRVHQIGVTPLETVHHSKRVQLMAPNRNPVLSPTVYQKVTHLETVQHNNEVLTPGVPIPKHAPLPNDKPPLEKNESYNRVRELFPCPLQKPHPLHTLQYQQFCSTKCC